MTKRDAYQQLVAIGRDWQPSDTDSRREGERLSRLVRAADALERSGRRPVVRRWWPALAIAASVVVAVWVTRWLLTDRGGTRDDGMATLSQPVEAVRQVGDQVAVLAQPGTVYRIERATEMHTRIFVTTGTVTARLDRSRGDHKLVLATDGMEVQATGTVFSLVVPRGKSAFTFVHEGRVEVRYADGNAGSAAAGKSHPPGWRDADADAAGRVVARATLAVRAQPLNQNAEPPVDLRPPSEAPTATPPKRRSPTTKTARERDIGRKSSVREASTNPPKSPSELWRQARLLRGRGEDAAALDVLTKLIQRRDSDWSPTALLESMRIYRRQGKAAQVRMLSADFVRDYPDHTLLPEVKRLVCGGERASAPAFCRDD